MSKKLAAKPGIELQRLSSREAHDFNPGVAQHTGEEPGTGEGAKEESNPCYPGYPVS